jgi:hypothetical protein
MASPQTPEDDSPAKPRTINLSRLKPWESEGISRMTWYRRRKGIKPRAINPTRTKPWESEGIGRTTWYRRRKES